MRGYITDPEAPAGLRLAEDLPEPDPGPDELLIEVRAVSINRGELKLLERRPDGWRPGQDLAGVVVRAATSGTGPAEGARVVAIAEMQGWAQRVALPATVVAELPASVTFEQAAALPIAGLTALRAFRFHGSILGGHVLVTGGTGAVGQLAIQLAAGAGARVTAQVSAPGRAEQVRALGALDVVTDLEEEGERFDLVLDGIGGDLLRSAIRRLAPEGTAVSFGDLAGDTTLSFRDLRVGPGAKLVGLYHGHPQETRGEDLATLARLVGEGRLDPGIGSVRDFSELRESLDALRRRDVRGKAVVTVD